MAKSVRITNFALDDSPLRGGTIILRGVIDPDSLENIQFDDYQREVLALTPNSRIMQGLRKGEPFPDVELGMRGQKFIEKNGSIYLQDDVFGIDGLQRISGAIKFQSLFPGQYAHLGATIHFNTTREWEKERFEILNVSRVKVSPNVLLRNKRETSPCLSMLYDLSNDDTRFVLYQRVSWEQTMRRDQLLTAMVLLRTFSSLHRHLGAIQVKGGRQSDVIPMMDRVIERAGVLNAKLNIREFYNLVDECWGIKMIQYKDTATQLRAGFLNVLGRVLSDHSEFWEGVDDKRLKVAPDLRKKLSSFPLSDPTVMSLASGGGKSGPLLYRLIIDHLNSGKRTKHLKARNAVEPLEEEAA